MQRARGLLAVGGVAVLAACSTVPYATQISGFADATLDASASGAAMRKGQRIDQQRHDRLIRRLGEAAFVPSPDCAVTPEDTGECGYVQAASKPARAASPAAAPLARPSGTRVAGTAAASDLTIPAAPEICLTPPGAAELGEVRPGAVARAALTASDGSQVGRPVREQDIYDTLSRYGAALKAISNAQDRKAFDDAAGKLASSVASAVSTVGAAAGGAGAAAGPVAGAVLRLTAFVASAALEQRRYDALKANLLAACIPVRTLAIAAGLLMEGHREIRIGVNNDTMVRGRAPRPPGPLDDAAFAAGEEAADAIETLRTPPLEAALAMVKAHDALVVAVASGSGQSLQVVEAIDEFTRLARALRQPLPAAAAGKSATAQ